MASDDPPRGFPVKILNKEVDEKYLCKSCHLLMRNPTQSFCGHRFCSDCVNYILSRSPTPSEGVLCPACSAEGTISEYSMLKSDQVFPDNAMKRDFAGFTAYCINEGCNWRGTFRVYENHLLECAWESMECPHCKTQVKRIEFQEHTDPANGKCPGPLEQCPYKCDIEVRRADMKNHLDENVVKHLSAILQRIEEVEKSRSEGASSQEIQGMKSNLEAFRADLARFQSSIGERGPGFAAAAPVAGASNTEVDAKLALLENKLITYERIMGLLNDELKKCVEVQNDMQKQMNRVGTLERRLTTLEKSTALRDVNQAETTNRVTTLEQTSYDGTFIWRITEFSRRRREAISGVVTSIYSPSFWTSRHGYKICSRLYLNGDGMGRGTHMSVFFVLMRGRYDALLKWPFSGRVSFKLRNQSGGQHETDSFKPDPTSSSFKRPTTEMNIASGSPLFVSLSALNSPGQAFVKDDVMFLEINVAVADFP